MNSYEATLDLQVYETEPGEWRAQAVGAPVFVFAGSRQELEVEAARVLTNYIDWISENRPDRDAFQRQCHQLGLEVQFTGSSEEQPQRVLFISRKGIPEQKVTVLLQGTLLGD